MLIESAPLPQLMVRLSRFVKLTSVKMLSRTTLELLSVQPKPWLSSSLLSVMRVAARGRWRSRR
jgi:hypothetical protein